MSFFYSDEIHVKFVILCDFFCAVRPKEVLKKYSRNGGAYRVDGWIRRPQRKRVESSTISLDLS